MNAGQRYLGRRMFILSGLTLPFAFGDAGVAVQSPSRYRYFVSRKPGRGAQTPTINVVTRGARGDKTFDNTVVIMKCLQELLSAGGGRLYFPSGTYLFSNIEFELPFIEWFGENATLLCNLPKVTKVPAIWLRGGDIYLHDISLDYVEPVDVRIASDVRYRGANAYGLRVGGRRDPTPLFASSVRLERLTVRNARGGGIQVSRASNVIVNDCKVNQALGNGIGFDDCLVNVRATNNTIGNTGDDLLVVVTDSFVPHGTQNVTFSHNTVYNGFAKGIASTGVDGMLIANNNVSNTFGGGICIINDQFYGLGPSRNVLVKNNTIKKAGFNFGAGLFRPKASDVGDSIYVSTGTSNITIENNVLQGGVRDGIVVTNSSGIRVTGNQITNHPGAGINIGSQSGDGIPLVESLSVTGNYIKQCGVGVALGRTSDAQLRGNTVIETTNIAKSLMLYKNQGLMQ